jgi:hypothetical protein
MSWEAIAQNVITYAIEERWRSIAACLDAAMGLPNDIGPECPISVNWESPSTKGLAEYLDPCNPADGAIVMALKSLGHEYSGPASDWVNPHLITAIGGVLPATWFAAYQLFMAAECNERPVTVPTIVVCGFPRSGTSLMMAMLGAGGVPLFYDQPGSYEAERVMGLPDDIGWLALARGRALKVLEPQRYRLPDGPYKFIWMARQATHIAQSQSGVLDLMLGEGLGPHAKAALANTLMRDSPKIKVMLQQYQDSKFMEVRFTDLIERPLEQAGRVAEYLGLDGEAARQMAAVVLPRSPEPSASPMEVEIKLARAKQGRQQGGSDAQGS